MTDVVETCPSTFVLPWVGFYLFLQVLLVQNMYVTLSSGYSIFFVGGAGGGGGGGGGGCLTVERGC